MHVNNLKNTGGITSLTRYVNFLAGNTKFIASVPSNMLAVGQDGSPYFHAYAFSSSTGFGSRYNPGPAISPSFYAQDVSFNRIQTLIGIADYSSPYIDIYPLTPAGGYGTKWSNPPALPAGTGKAISFNYDSTAVALSHDTSPNISVYAITASAFGTKYANPASAPSSTYAGGVKISNGYVFVGTNSNEYIYGYNFTTTNGFGTKFAAPTSPGYTPYVIDFNESISTLIFGGIGFASIYPITQSGFGTKYSNLSGAPWAYGAKFNLAGNTVFIGDGLSSTEKLAAYPFSTSSGGGTKYTAPSSAPAGSVSQRSVAVTYDSNAVAILTQTAPYIYAYPFTVGTGFGSKYADPSTALSYSGTGINFN